MAFCVGLRELVVQAALIAQTLVTDAISGGEIACALAFRSERTGRPFAAGLRVDLGHVRLERLFGLIDCV